MIAKAQVARVSVGTGGKIAKNFGPGRRVVIDADFQVEMGTATIAFVSLDTDDGSRWNYSAVGDVGGLQVGVDDGNVAADKDDVVSKGGAVGRCADVDESGARERRNKRGGARAVGVDGNIYAWVSGFRERLVESVSTAGKKWI